MRGFALASLLLLTALTACDHDEDTTYKSIFPKDDVLGREVSGRVRRGFELTDGAIVQISASPGYRNDEAFAPNGSVVTDEFGFYRFAKAPIRYDLNVRLGSDVAVFRGLVYRGFDAPFANGVPPRSYVSRVSLTAVPAPAQGHGVAFFATGDGIYDVTGDLTNGLSVTSTMFTSTATIAAVEYDGNLAHPVASGSVTVEVSNAVATTTATLQLLPIVKDDHDVLLDATPPAGATLDPITWGITFASNFSIRPIASVPSGTHIRFTLVPGARYTYRARATLGGAVSDSGVLDLPVFDKMATAKMYDFPVIESPVDGQFTAHTTGVREHAFTGSASSIRFISTDDTVTIPDVSSVGGVAPKDSITWTVHAWPTTETILKFQGLDVRDSSPSVSSHPIVVLLR